MKQNTNKKKQQFPVPVIAQQRSAPTQIQFWENCGKMKQQLDFSGKRAIDNLSRKTHSDTFLPVLLQERNQISQEL